MELYENKFIYVINHCLNSIDNDVINFNYIKSIKLPEQFLSATNGIAVVTEDDFFFSTSFGIHPPATDKANFFNKKMPLFSVAAGFLLNLKLTYLYHF